MIFISFQKKLICQSQTSDRT